jgi:hypothetical protein
LYEKRQPETARWQSRWRGRRFEVRILSREVKAKVWVSFQVGWGAAGKV